MITEFEIPTSGHNPNHISVGPDGSLWFTEDVGGQIGRINTHGVITKYLVPTPSRLGGITAGPDGNVWFLESNANKIVKATIPSGQLTILPTTGGNTGKVTAQIFNGLLPAGATVKLTGIGPDIAGVNTTVSNGSIISTTFDLTGATPGLRTLLITSLSNTSATLPNAFTIEQGGAPQIWVDLVGRDQIRSGSKQTYYVVYGNRGNIDAGVGHFWVSFPSPLGWNADLLPASVEEVLSNGDVILGFDIFPVPAGSVGAIPITLEDKPTPEGTFRIKVWSIEP